MTETPLEQNNQYVTFVLGQELYAFDVRTTREIADYAPITPIPNTPEWVLGVINLRGSIIPVLDIRRKFGLAVRERTNDTRIIVIELDLPAERFVLGILADAVKNVLELPPAQIEPPPRFGAQISVDYVRGIGRIGTGFFLILDVTKIFSTEELASATEVSAR